MEMAENKPGEVFSIKDLSDYLKIPISTLYKLVGEGKIPSQKIGRQWRFRKETIDRWLDRKLPEESVGDIKSE